MISPKSEKISSMKRNFFDTGMVTWAGIQDQIPRVLKYVVANRDIVLPAETTRVLAQSIRTILKNPMAEFFNRILSEDQLSNFATIYIQPSEISIPEVIASQNITMDLKQVRGTDVLRSLPELYNKPIINLTTALKPDRTYGGLTVSAVDSFQQMFCRAQMVASYYDNDVWLSPYLGEFVVRTYSMIISSIISKLFSLSLDETMKVMGVCAIFMSQLLDPDEGNPTMPSIYNRCTFIGSRSELEAIAGEVSDITAGGVNINKLPEMIKRVGPDRMKSFNLQMLFSTCGNLGPEVVTGRIALEYPPYWTYCLLLALSGVKTPMIYQLNNCRLSNEGRSKFLSSLLTYEKMFDLRR